MSDELDDLRDLGGRVRRTLASTVAGIASSALTLVAIDRVHHIGSRGGDWFALFTMVLMFLAGFAAVSAALRYRAGRRWRDRRIPQARRVR